MPRIKPSRRRTLLFATLSIVAGIITISACSSEENPPAGSVTLVLSPTSVNIAPGGSGTSSATITRSGSFTGAVTLSASGNPTGITVTFSPDEIPGAATTATVEISVGAAVTPGNNTITISAAGNGVTTATATLTVVVVPATNGAIGLAADPALLTANVGGAAVTSVITVSRTAPFTGPVALTVTGAPAGVTATVTPTSVTAATSTLTVQATTGAVNGAYPIVIHGAGTGVANATTTVTVTVTGGAAQGASFTFNPTSVPITAGGASATSVVTVTRSGGFTGPLNLAITGQPAGMTATVAPNPNTNAATSTITVQATNAVAAGTYNLTLTGTGTGIPNATGTLPVVVTGGGGGGGSVSFTYCAENAPIWVAYQDGAGAWTRATPTGNTYQFTFASDKGGVAVVQPDGSGGNDLSVIYATVSEFTGAAGGLAAAGCGTKTVTGSVASVGAAEAAAVYLGPSTASASLATPNFVLNDVPDGSLDLMATRTTLPFTVNKIILRQGLNQQDNSAISPTLDFGTQGFVPSTANTVTLGNIGSDNAVITSAFLGLNGSVRGGVGSIVGYTQASGAVAYSAIPVGELRTGELQSLTTFAADASNSNAARYAGVYFHTPANTTITYGPDLTSPTVTKTVAATVALPRMVLPGQTAYNKLFIANYTQGDPTNRDVSVIATAGYFPTAPTTSWDVAVPDLSGVTGWVATWGLLDGTAIDWSVLVQGGTAQFLDPPTDGGTFQWAGLSSSTPLTLRSLREDPALLQRRLLDFIDRNRNPLR